MKVSLTRLRAAGLRCPDFEMNLTADGKVRRVNLIQMPNGTGKSTIIELIEAALTGSGKDWQKTQVLEFASTSRKETVGNFELDLLIEGGTKSGDQTVTFQIDFDFVSGTVNYFTNSDSRVGLSHGWNPPRELRGFLTKNCVEVFIFKGDKAEDLLSQSKNDAEVAISAFFRIDDLLHLSEKIDREFLSRTSGVKTGQGFSRQKNELDKINERLETLKAQRKELQNKRIPIQESKTQLHKQVEEILGNQTQNDRKRRELTESLETAKERLNLGSINYFEALRNPFFLSSGLEDNLLQLKQKMDKLKLPGTSGEFFKELSNEDLCICDRPIDEEARTAILNRASSFLSDDDINIVNGLKRDITKFSEQAKELRATSPLQELRAATEDYNDLSNKLSLHIKRMENEATEQQRVILQEFERVEGALTEIDGVLRLLDKDGSVEDEAKTLQQALQCKKIPVLEKKILKLQEELAVATNTIEELNAKNKLKAVIEISAQKALGKLKIELKNKANAKLAQILPEGESLKILEIDKNVQLGGITSSQRKGSGGQNVSVAYSFATSLLERSGAQFPMIVDHPVTALDDTSRIGVGGIISKICHQFVGFIINTEKPSFIDALENSTTSINYITLFKIIPGNEKYIEDLPLPAKGVVTRSQNGVVCTDKKYFHEFRDLHADSEI